MLRDIQKTSFEGKTIKEIDNSSVNVIHFHFTDGTSVSVWTEPKGHGIVGFSESPYERICDH